MAGRKAALRAELERRLAALDDDGGVYEEPNGSWRMLIRLPNGRQTTRRRTPDGSRVWNREDALDARADWQERVVAGAVTGGRMRFDVYWEKYLAMARAEMTE